MKTQAYFENLQEQIIAELEKAHVSIIIAVAWFTDSKLFNLLLKKASDKVLVELLIANDEINNNCNIDYTQLVKEGGKVWKAGTGEQHDVLMHNKFCIIDSETIINGSYNWTKKAQQNHESITVMSGDAELAERFICEFNSIKEKYFGVDVESVLIDYGKICIRFETLKNAVLLEDKEDIALQLKKLKLVIKPENKEEKAAIIKQIIKFTEVKQYGDAIVLINDFIARFKALTVYVDTEIAALKLELKALELQIGALEDEKTEIEKLIHDFEVRHSQELGELILKILRLRREKLKEEAKKDETKKKEYAEAEKDFKEYNQTYEATKDEHILELTEEQRKDLKTSYRKASKLCHPDVVADEHKAEAEKMFKDLKDAYDKNDLLKVNELLSCLEKGIFQNKSEKIDEKKKLKNIIERLRIKRNEIEKTVNDLKNNETFKTLEFIGSWDEYFAETKQKLTLELENITAK